MVCEAKVKKKLDVWSHLEYNELKPPVISISSFIKSECLLNVKILDYVFPRYKPKNAAYSFLLQHVVITA